MINPDDFIAIKERVIDGIKKLPHDYIEDYYDPSDDYGHGQRVLYLVDRSQVREALLDIVDEVLEDY